MMVSFHFWEPSKAKTNLRDKKMRGENWQKPWLIYRARGQRSFPKLKEKGFRLLAIPSR